MQGKLPQRPSALPRLPPVAVEEWERFRDDWGRITTDSELKFKARVFYGVNIITNILCVHVSCGACIYSPLLNTLILPSLLYSFNLQHSSTDIQ